MYNNRRFGKIRRKNPLIFRNPFRSGYVTNEPKLIVAPIRREGITSIENAERERVQKRFSELGNAGMLKQMKEYGMIPDDFQVDMAKFTGNTASTLHGVASLEQVAKEGDAARQIERMNAGILSEEERKRKILYELAEKRKRELGIEKTIQWLATTDELDEVPIEFQEEVDKYYNDPKKIDSARVKEIKKARQDRKDAKSKKEDEKRMAQKYWESKPGWDFISPKPGESYRYTDDPSIPIRNDSYINEMRRIIDEKEVPKLVKETDSEGTRDLNIDEMDDGLSDISDALTSLRGELSRINADVDDLNLWFSSAKFKKASPRLKQSKYEEYTRLKERQNGLSDEISKLEKKEKELYQRKSDLSVGKAKQQKRKKREAAYGIIRRRYDIPNTEGSGWRAPRLHNLVRPLKKFNMGETPEQIVGEQKDALDERRSKFKEQAMFHHGVYPSKDEIESAIPKIVEPFTFEPRNIPNPNIILHPFIFPSKKYMVKTGVF